MYGQEASEEIAKRNLTIVDIAASAGVSTRTVSRVLSGSDCVNHKTRQRVEAEIVRSGFQPNRRASAMAVGRSFLVGVIESDANPVAGDLQSGLLSVAGEAGYEVVIHPVPATCRDPAGSVCDFVRRSRVDGVIVLPPLSEHEYVAAILRKMDLPAVGVAAVRIPDFAAVLLCDDERAAGEVGAHLVAQGHRKIAIVTGPADQASSQRREAGFRAALTRAGLDLPANRRIEGDYTFESGRAAGERLLSQAEPPTAVFACCDLMAAGLIGVALERGLSLPRDLSVVGFGDGALARVIWPALTSMQLPLADLAHRAMDRLLSLIEDRPDARRDEPVRLRLVTRASTAAPGRAFDLARPARSA